MHGTRKSQIALLASLIAVAPVLAHEAGATFAERVEEAELVFEGRVLEVDYALSEPDDMTGARLPHTFVTFSIDRAFKGRVEGDTITLRFFGGLEDGGIMLTSTSVPLFDAGEQVVLLVRGNQVADSPLVGWRFGRFRVIGERVYDDFGREVILKDEDDLGFGPRHEFAEVLNHRLGDSGQELNLARGSEACDPFDADSPDGSSPVPAPEAKAANRAAEARTFRTWVASIVDRHEDPEDLELSQPVASADARRPFTPRSVKPAAAAQR